MKGPAYLSTQEGILRTRAGAVYPGSHAIFLGKDLHQEFARAEWMDLYIFACTERRFSTQELKLLNALWVYTSYPDTRLWNNRVAALAGTTRSTANLAHAAAIATCEATIFGQGPFIKAY